MPKVELTRAEWEIVLTLLDYEDRIMTNNIMAEIIKQLDNQEY